MGGKSFFCDYCRCYMTNDLNVRKTHNAAVSHKMNKIRYMRKFEDPRKVYEEEICKQPCSHFFKGCCRYDLYCQSSHFNRKQLKDLEEIADNLSIKEKQQETSTNTNATTTESLKRLLPWNRDVMRKQSNAKLKNLPPSLRPINIKKLANIMGNNNNWG